MIACFNIEAFDFCFQLQFYYHLRTFTRKILAAIEIQNLFRSTCLSLSSYLHLSIELFQKNFYRQFVEFTPLNPVTQSGLRNSFPQFQQKLNSK